MRTLRRNRPSRHGTVTVCGRVWHMPGASRFRRARFRRGPGGARRVQTPTPAGVATIRLVSDHLPSAAGGLSRAPRARVWPIAPRRRGDRCHASRLRRAQSRVRARPQRRVPARLPARVRVQVPTLRPSRHAAIPLGAVERHDIPRAGAAPGGDTNYPHASARVVPVQPPPVTRRGRSQRSRRTLD